MNNLLAILIECEMRIWERRGRDISEQSRHSNITNFIITKPAQKDPFTILLDKQFGLP